MGERMTPIAGGLLFVVIFLIVRTLINYAQKRTLPKMRDSMREPRTKTLG